jgi:filamentous hemagglutinin
VGCLLGPKTATIETPKTFNPNRVSPTPLELVQQAPGQPKRIAKIKMDHVLDGEVKTHVNNSGKVFKRGVGGHYLKSSNIRVLR